jgi:hypothetical protein
MNIEIKSQPSNSETITVEKVYADQLNNEFTNAHDPSLIPEQRHEAELSAEFVGKQLVGEAIKHIEDDPKNAARLHTQHMLAGNAIKLLEAPDKTTS